MPLSNIMAAGVELAVGGDRGWSPGDGTDAPRIVFQPELIVRDSTAPAPRARSGPG
jgi:hypothetical protein